MAATAAQAAPNGQAGAPDELATSDEVKEYCHEGEGENTEHLNSMDLHDIKTELEKDAEAEETPKGSQARNANTTPPVVSPCNPPIQLRPTVVQPMVYTNGFMVPQFAATPTIYPVAAAASIRPVKMELQTSSADWIKSSQGISIPYSYQAGLVPSLSMDQSIRQAYPFIVPGQYVTPMQYQQQLTALGTPAAPNAMVQPHSGIIAPQQKDKKPHVKKPLNAFMLFMKEKRGDVIKECTLKESAAINQILGKMWHKLDKSEQAKYYEMAREERTKHMQMYPGWSARDNYAIHKKRRKKKAKPKVDDNDDDNPRKCRARYGMDQQHMWCGSCRRKKKCIRASEGDEEEECESKCEGMADDANTSSAERVIANSSHQTDSLAAGSSLSATLSSKSTPTEESVPSSLTIKQEAST